MNSLRARVFSLFAGALVASGCGSRSPEASLPQKSQATAESVPKAPADAPKPSAEPGASAPATAPAAVAEKTAPDSPAAPKPAASIAGSVDVVQSKAEVTAAAQPAAPPPPKEPPKPSAEQVAKWRITDFAPMQLLACRDGFGEVALFGMAMSQSGEQFVLSGSKLTLWNMKDTKPAFDFLAKYKSGEVERPIQAVDLSDDGKWLAAGDQKGNVRIWSLDDQHEARAFAAYRGHIRQLAFSPNSKILATTSYSGDVALWQVPEGKPIKVLKVSNEEITHLVFLTDNVFAAASNEVSLWEVDSGNKSQALTGKNFRATGFALAQDRRVLAFNDTDTTAQLWDVPNARSSGTIIHGAGTALAAFSHDGKWLASRSSDLTITIWDTATGSPVQVIDADGDLTTALQWNPKANVLLVASSNGRIRLWGTAEEGRSVGLEPMPAPALAAVSANAGKPLGPAQLRRVVDIRSLPRLPGAVPQWSSFSMCGYSAQVSQDETGLFYRYVLGKAGWAEMPAPATPGGLAFQKDGCELNVTFTTAEAAGTKDPQISVHFAGNYDMRKLPKASPSDSKSVWDSFTSVIYRTKASIVDTEVALLRQMHDAGWTPYTRLAASGIEDPNARHISALQGGSVLTVFVSRPAEATSELAVQTSVSVTNRSLPIPPDAGWIEFDNSTNLQTVINTKLDLSQTVKFYDEAMAADGWLARDAGRQVKDDKGFLPYIRGQQDILLRLYTRPSGGTRVVVGEAEQTSWQLKAPAAKKPADQPGIEAADFALPAGAKDVKYDVDEKHIEFSLDDTTAPKLSEQVAKQIESLGWKRTKSGIMSDEYVLITFENNKIEIQFRARADGKTTSAIVAGDGISWDKPLPVAPVPVSYETWLRRGRKEATLEKLDEFAAEMHKIEAGTAPK